MALRTTVEKALHQVRRGRRPVWAADFNRAVRDRGPALCACIGSDCATKGCWASRFGART